MAQVENETADIGVLQPELGRDIEAAGIQDLVIVADADVAGDIAEMAADTGAAAIFLTVKRDFLTAQTEGVSEDIVVFAEDLRHGVSVFALGSLEGLHGAEAGLMAEAPKVVLV